MKPGLRSLSMVAAVLALQSCGGSGEYPKVDGDTVVTSSDPVEWQTGAREESSNGKTTGDYSDGAAVPGAAESDGAAASGTSSGTGAVTQPQGAGILTAGSFDDHLNAASFDSFLASQQSLPAGCPGLAARAVIRVSGSDGRPVPNAQIEVRSGAGVLLSTVTGSDGRALFLPAFDGASADGVYEVRATADGLSTSGQFELSGADWTLALPAAFARPQALDLAFVVDTTGSMGDELEFIKAEVSHIVAAVDARFPATDLRLALVVYRDQGDEYVTRGYGFGDLAYFQSRLALQSSDGGGDEPEAVHTALAEAASLLPWRQGNVARVLFHVADAPPHDESVGAAFEATSQLRKAGIRVYPVASSGTNALAEYFMRSEAFATLGRFLFLTDDSGVGNTHSEPRVPCYEVQLLEDLIVRMVSSELAGALIPADPAQVLRTEGTPVNGVCE